MAIYELRQVDLRNPTGVEDLIGNRMYAASIRHSIQFLGQRGLGLSYDSCSAAVAVEWTHDYDSVTVAGMTFSLVYGSSRLYAGLDLSFNRIHNNVAPKRMFSKSQYEEHAEQTAIRVADSEGLNYWDHNGHAHIYVDFEPCENCEPWLEEQDEIWVVHYFARLDRQKDVSDEKKRKRSQAFGRQMETGVKKRRL